MRDIHSVPENMRNALCFCLTRFPPKRSAVIMCLMCVRLCTLHVYFIYFTFVWIVYDYVYFIEKNVSMLILPTLLSYLLHHIPHLNDPMYIYNVPSFLDRYLDNFQYFICIIKVGFSIKWFCTTEFAPQKRNHGEMELLNLKIGCI